MAEDRIALRELGQKITLFSRYHNSKSQGRAELLGLLRSGKLTARFDVPSDERPQIDVPATYWNDVKIGQFRKALDGNNANKGDYLVTPENFANEYLNWFSQNHRLPEHVDELSAALRAGSKKVEVYVLAKDWERFTAQEGLDTTQHSTVDQKSSRGQSENPNWSAILVEVAVELLSASRESRPVTKVIAGAALSRVTPRGKTQLPTADTVGKKVDEIIHRTWKT
jgi:hypothetical protein